MWRGFEDFKITFVNQWNDIFFDSLIDAIQHSLQNKVLICICQQIISFQDILTLIL